MPHIESQPAERTPIGGHDHSDDEQPHGRGERRSRLRDREDAKFRALLESAPDAMVIVDAGGTIMLVNLQTERIFGYPRDELVGEPVEMLLPERFRPGHAQHRIGYLSTAQVRPMGEGLVLMGRRSDGTEFPVDISLAPLETEEGMLVSAAIRDVTDRERAEEQARRLRQLQASRRQALELNDEVVQGLTVAKLAHSLGQHEHAADAIDKTLRAAQRIISQMLADQKGEDPLVGGDLRRERAAQVSEEEGG